MSHNDADTEKFVLSLLAPDDHMHAQGWNEGLTRSWNTLAHQPVSDIVDFIKQARAGGVRFRDTDDNTVAKKIQEFGKH